MIEEISEKRYFSVDDKLLEYHRFEALRAEWENTTNQEVSRVNVFEVPFVHHVDLSGLRVSALFRGDEIVKCDVQVSYLELEASRFNLIKEVLVDLEKRLIEGMKSINSYQNA